jgi:hypothetical protein
MTVYECAVVEGTLCLKVDVKDRKEAFECMRLSLGWLKESPFYWKEQTIAFQINDVDSVEMVM